MKNNHAKLYQALDRGICSSCDHALVCRLHGEDERPVFFCEEFACVPETPKHSRPHLYSLPGRCEGRIPLRKSEQARLSYIGLCRTCANLSTCTLLKPGGGTWQCDSYEKDPACECPTTHGKEGEKNR